MHDWDDFGRSYVAPTTSAVRKAPTYNARRAAATYARVRADNERVEQTANRTKIDAAVRNIYQQRAAATYQRWRAGEQRPAAAAQNPVDFTLGAVGGFGGALWDGTYSLAAGAFDLAVCAVAQPCLGGLVVNTVGGAASAVGDFAANPPRSVSDGLYALSGMVDNLGTRLNSGNGHEFGRAAGDITVGVFTAGFAVKGAVSVASKLRSGVAQADGLLPGLPADAPAPLGLGSTGRFTPLNLAEQLAMTEVRAKPAGHVLPITLFDSRWPAHAGWVKMEQIVNGKAIHYVWNATTGAVDDFKFKP